MAHTDNLKNQEQHGLGNLGQIGLETLKFNVECWMGRIAEDMLHTKNGDPMFDYLDGKHDGLSLVHEHICIELNQSKERK